MQALERTLYRSVRRLAQHLDASAARRGALTALPANYYDRQARMVVDMEPVERDADDAARASDITHSPRSRQEHPRSLTRGCDFASPSRRGQPRRRCVYAPGYPSASGSGHVSKFVGAQHVAVRVPKLEDCCSVARCVTVPNTTGENNCWHETTGFGRAACAATRGWGDAVTGIDTGVHRERFGGSVRT